VDSEERVRVVDVNVGFPPLLVEDVLEVLGDHTVDEKNDRDGSGR
jgi:hypothetical protein